MYHSPLTRYEQETLGYKAHFEAFPRTLAALIERWITQTLRVGPTGRYVHSQNSELSAFRLHLATTQADRSECSVNDECCMIQPSYC
jgi:hypothetical protein